MLYLLIDGNSLPCLRVVDEPKIKLVGSFPARVVYSQSSSLIHFTRSCTNVCLYSWGRSGWGKVKVSAGRKKGLTATPQPGTAARNLFCRYPPISLTCQSTTVCMAQCAGFREPQNKARLRKLSPYSDKTPSHSCPGEFCMTEDYKMWGCQRTRR